MAKNQSFHDSAIGLHCGKEHSTWLWEEVIHVGPPYNPSSNGVLHVAFHGKEWAESKEASHCWRESQVAAQF